MPVCGVDSLYVKDAKTKQFGYEQIRIEQKEK